MHTHATGSYVLDWIPGASSHSHLTAVGKHGNYFDCHFLQDEDLLDGKIVLTFFEPMKGFRDVLYLDEQLQMSIGNPGCLNVIQQKF